MLLNRLFFRVARTKVIVLAGGLLGRWRYVFVFAYLNSSECTEANTLSSLCKDSFYIQNILINVCVCERVKGVEKQ